MYAKRFNFMQKLKGDFFELHHDAFGNFDGEQTGGDRVVHDSLGNLIIKTGILELPCRNITGDVDIVIPALFHPPDQAGGLFDDPVSKDPDESGIFSDMDKLRRCNQPLCRMLPAKQRLCSDNRPGLDIDLGAEIHSPVTPGAYHRRFRPLREFFD